MHQVKQRIDREPILARDNRDYLKKIKDEIIAHLKEIPPMPILIMCKDVASSKELYEFLNQCLQNSIANLQLYNGVDYETKDGRQPITAATEAAVIKAAGVAGTITITTPMLSRGADIKPDKKTRGLFVLNTFLSSLRITGQIIGRSGREGFKGELLLIVNKQELRSQCHSR